MLWIAVGSQPWISGPSLLSINCALPGISGLRPCFGDVAPKSLHANNGTRVRAQNAKTAENTSIDAQTVFKKAANMTGNNMALYAVVSFVSAIIAAVLGFGVMAGATAGSAKVLSGVLLLLFVVIIIGPPKQKV